MRPLIKIAWTIIAVLLLLICWWGYQQFNPPTKGTANTVAELKGILPLSGKFATIPEVGPFEWEKRSQGYTIRESQRSHSTFQMGRFLEKKMIMKIL
ncbi:MAG: hypothetical protein R3C11_22590 [Planctomycetaceae bacterium]